MTGLRFLLAFWVILNHLVGQDMMLEPWLQTLPHALQNLLRDGYLAVQSFFILSGFVLAQSYLTTEWNRETLKRFAVARFARIYPVYALSLIVVGRFIAETLAKPGRTAAHKAVILGDYVFLLLGWLTPRGVGWNTPAWSLSCEFVFYLSFPLLFLWLRKNTRLRLAVALATAMALPVALAHAGVPAQYKPIHHMADFIAGIAAAGLFRRAGAWRGRGYWLYLPALAGTFFLIARPEVLGGTVADLNTALRPLNVLLLIGLALEGGWFAKALAHPVADYLGQASYSMYILHVPLLWWYTRYAFHKLGAAPHYPATLAFLACVILFSMAAFELVEKPANRWLRAGRGAGGGVKRLARTTARPRPAFETPAVSYPPESVPATGGYGD